jgi:hypothetical protein
MLYTNDEQSLVPGLSDADVLGGGSLERAKRELRELAAQVAARLEPPVPAVSKDNLRAMVAETAACEGWVVDAAALERYLASVPAEQLGGNSVDRWWAMVDAIAAGRGEPPHAR